MKRVSVVRRAAVTAATLALALSGCRNTPDKAPPRATDAIVIPEQESSIAVPVTANLSELSAALEREVPRQLWTIDKPNQVCVASTKVKVLIVKIKTPTIKCRIVGVVTRGRMSLSGPGQELFVTMPIHAVVSARDIGGILKRETATADARVRARVRLRLQQDWNPKASLDISYDWTDEPHIDFLGQRIEFTSKADARLQKVIARLERTLPAELAKLRLRDKVAGAWASAFTSLELNRANPSVWARITPRRLQYGGYAISNRALSLNLGMTARIETVVGPRPADPPATPLPPLAPLTAKAGQVRFAIPVIADYAQLEPIVLEALVKRSRRPFVLPGLGPVNARFEKITAYGTTGGRIAVGLGFTAARPGGSPSRGTIWLVGLPVTTPNSRKLAFTDLSVFGATDSTGTDLLLKLANSPALSGIVADALTQNLSKDYADLLGKISRAIAEKREGDLVIRARIDEVETGELKAAGQGLYLPVWGKGTASITLDR